MTHIYPISTTEVTITVIGTNLSLTNKSDLSPDLNPDSVDSAQYLLECISWDNVVSLEYAFLGCISLTSVPIDLPSATNLRFMFTYTTAFNQDLSSWDVSNVTNFLSMFESTRAFNQDLSSWDVSNVTNFSRMFLYSVFDNDSIALTWTMNPTNPMNMSRMFQECPFNQDISSWDVSTVYDFTSMFSDCPLFDNGGVALTWTMNPPVNSMNMSYMFQNSPFNQDISSWNVSKVNSFYYMFSGSVFDNGGVPLTWTMNPLNSMDMAHMFEQCVFNQDISSWDVSKVFSFYFMFYESPFNNGGVPLTWIMNPTGPMNMQEMFRKSSFNQDISSWDVSTVVTFNGMFNSAVNFNKPLPWDTSQALDFSAMFDGATSFNQTLNWNVSNSISFESMFANTKSFNNGGQLLTWKINATTPVTMFGMFQDAKSFNQYLDLNTSQVTNFDYMFAGATSFNQYLDLNTSQVTNFDYMFAGATSFNNGDYPFDWSMNPTSSMIRMFYGASSFNQDLSYLDYTTISINGFVSYSGLNILHYTKLLKKLSETNKTNVDFGGELMICCIPDYYDTLGNKSYTFVNNISSDRFFFESNKSYTFTVYNIDDLLIEGDPIVGDTFTINGTNTFSLADNQGSRTVIIYVDIIPIPPHVYPIPFAEDIMTLLPENTFVQFSSELNVAFGIDPFIIIQCISDGDPLPLLTGYVFLSLDIPREFEYSIPIIITQTNGIDINGTSCLVGESKVIGDYKITTLFIGSGLFNIELAIPVPPVPPVYPISPICFIAGTPITTDQGNFPIESLTTQTIKGYSIEITKTISPDSYLVCFEKHALARNFPSERTIMTKDHMVYFGYDESKAKDYVGRYKGVHKIPYRGEPLYNVLLPIHYTMTVNRMKCETLNPHHIIAKIYKKGGKEQTYILSVLERLLKQKKFNEYRYAVDSL